MTKQDIENIRKYLKQHNLDLYELTVNNIEWDDFLDYPDDPDSYIDDSGIGTDIYLRLVDSSTDETLAIGDSNDILNYLHKQTK